MKFVAWYSVLLGVSATCSFGCAPGTPSETQPTDPTGFTFQTLQGGFSSFGWTGQFAAITGAVGAEFGVQTTQCSGTGDDVTCRFLGPVDPLGPVHRRRCIFNTALECKTDSDCPFDMTPTAAPNTPTPCGYIYDPPISTPLGNGACSFTYIPIAASTAPPSISGTINLGTGALNLDNLDVILIINANAMGGFAGACDVCMGDAKPNDGKKDGFCTTPGGQPDMTRPCDINRVGTFANLSNNFSMDCAPKLTSGLGAPTEFGGSFSSKGLHVDINDQSPKCHNSTDTLNCLCSTCKDGRTPCGSDSDCITVGGHCGDVPDNCAPQPFPFLTDGKTPDMTATQGVPVGVCRSSLSPMMQDWTWTAPASACIATTAAPLNTTGGCNWDPNEDVGFCQTRNPLSGIPTLSVAGCFPAAQTGHPTSIDAQGSAQRMVDVNTTYQVSTASLRCEAPTNFATSNVAVGLPGPILQKRNFLIVPQFAGASQ